MRSLPERLSALDSCAISDALDTLGLPGAVVGIPAQSLPDAAVRGRVRTVQAGPSTDAGPHAHIAAALVDTANAGDVVVIANGGRADVSCWGGLLGRAAVRRGVVGVIVDGAFRDIQENADLGLAVFARACVPVSARGRIVQYSMDERVDVAGVAVESGDWVVADRSGIAFIRSGHAERIIGLAERIVAREDGMAAAVIDGAAVLDVMHDSKFPTAHE